MCFNRNKTGHESGYFSTYCVSLQRTYRRPIKYFIALFLFMHFWLFLLATQLVQILLGVFGWPLQQTLFILLEYWNKT